MPQDRIHSISLLKCLAALLITNSHFNGLYPESISFLAFGGFFGNSLFFLVSGFLLFNCDKVVFPKWYTKRVLRIYLPYLIIIPFLLFEQYTRTHEWGGVIEWLFPIRKFHFIPSIIVLYPFYYLLTTLNNRKKVRYEVSILIVFLIQLLYYSFLFDFSYEIDADFKLIPLLSYLQIMLIGGLIRQNKSEIKRYRWLFCGIVVVSFLVYVYQVFRPFSGHLGIIQLYAGLIFSGALACFIVSYEGRIVSVAIVEYIGNLTLEIYLVQFMLIDAFLYFAFPLNILLCLISIVATAYCVNYLSERLKSTIPIMK